MSKHKPSEFLPDHLAGVFEELEISELGSDPETALEAFQHAIDNCPECQAARARGEEPVIIPMTELARPSRWNMRPRWRDLKKRVRVN